MDSAIDNLCQDSDCTLWGNTSLANQRLGHGDFSFIDLTMYIYKKWSIKKAKHEMAWYQPLHYLYTMRWVPRLLSISKKCTIFALAIFQKPIYWPSGAGYTWQMTSDIVECFDTLPCTIHFLALYPLDSKYCKCTREGFLEMQHDLGHRQLQSAFLNPGSPFSYAATSPTGCL